MPGVARAWRRTPLPRVARRRVAAAPYSRTSVDRRSLDATRAVISTPAARAANDRPYLPGSRTRVMGPKNAATR